MRVGAYIHALARRHFGRSQMVEEHERPDISLLRKGQDAANKEAAEIALARFYDKFDRIGHGRLSVGMRKSMDEAA
jgi:hypothetical protein